MVEGVGFEPTYSNEGRFTVCWYLHRNYPISQSFQNPSRVLTFSVLQIYYKHIKHNSIIQQKTV